MQHNSKFLKYILVCVLSVWLNTGFAKEIILVYGDSLSAGYGVPIEQNWVSILAKSVAQKNSDYQIINMSVSGSTTSDGLDNVANTLQKYNPKIIILGLGSNDGLRGSPIATIYNNLEKMIQLMTKNNATVLLLSFNLPSNYGASYTNQFKQVFARLANKYNLVSVQFWQDKFAFNPDYLQADGIHPNLQAQQLIVDNIYPYLEKLL